MKRKLIAAVLASLCVCMSFTACGASEDTTSKTTSETVSTESTLPSMLESDADKVVSGAESITNELMPDENVSKENSKADKETSSAAESDASKEEASLPAAAGSALDLSAIQTLDATLQGWGHGGDVTDENVPVSCVNFQQTYGDYDALFWQESEEKNITLTFDEGYENGCTAQILNTLKQKQCPAVFFITGDYLEQSPELVQRMIEEGHQVGNHSQHHPSMPTISLEEAAAEITALSQAVEEQFGYQMTLFRPPKGEFSEQTLALTQQLGYQSVFWSYAYQDWLTDDQPNPEEALQKAMAAAHGGAIYLLHAVSTTNTEILGDFIDQMRTAGYTFTGIKEPSSTNQKEAS
jgi:peptidoglycan-N-acetylmuramic acid deacetylase